MLLLQVWQHETVAGKRNINCTFAEILEQYMVYQKRSKSLRFYGLINSFILSLGIYVEFSHSCLWLGNIHQFVEQYKQNDVSVQPMAMVR